MPWTFSVGKSKLPDTVKKDMVWDTTPLGKKKVDEYQGQATPKFNVLATLSELGPSNIEEIANAAHMGKDAVHFQLKQLLKAQCVRTLHAGGEQH